MKKHSVKYYETKIQGIKEKIERKKVFLAQLEKIIETEPDKSFEAGEQWNRIYDEIRKMKEAIHDLEFWRDAQDWDASDWTQYRLVCNNID